MGEMRTFQVDINQKQDFYPTLRCIARGTETADDEASVGMTKVDGKDAYMIQLKSEVTAENGLFGLENGKKFSDRAILFVPETRRLFVAKLIKGTDPDLSKRYLLEPKDRLALLASQALQCYGYKFAEEGNYKKFEQISSAAKTLDEERFSVNQNGTIGKEEISVPTSRVWNRTPVPVSTDVSTSQSPSLHSQMTFKVDLDQKHGFYPIVEAVGRGTDTADDKMRVKMTLTDDYEPAFMFQFSSEVLGKTGLFGLHHGGFSDHAIFMTFSGNLFATKIRPQQQDETAVAMRGSSETKPATEPKKILTDFSTKYLLSAREHVTLLISQALQCYAYKFADAGNYKVFEQLSSLSKLLDKNRRMLTPVGSQSFQKCSWYDFPCHQANAIDAGAVIW